MFTWLKNLFKSTPKEPKKVDVGMVDVTIHLNEGDSKVLRVFGSAFGEWMVSARDRADYFIKVWGQNNLAEVGNEFIPLCRIKKIEVSKQKEHLVNE